MASSRAPRAAALARCGEGIRRLAGLGERYDQRLRPDERVGIPQLAGELGGDGDAAELLKRLLADAARVIGGAAGGDDYGFYTPQCLVVKPQLLKFYAAAAETGLERGADGAGLLHRSP